MYKIEKIESEDIVMIEKGPVELFDMKVAHIGINAKNADEAAGFAKQFLDLFGLSTNETPISYFSDTLVEIMKQNGRGTNGHIGFSVNNVENAIEYFTKKGLKTIEETKKFDENGKCIFTYFEGEIGGFAIHLVQK